MSQPARHFGPRTIRSQVLLLVAAVTIPLVGLQAWSSWQEYQLAVRYEERAALTLAEATAVSAQQFMSGVRGLLTGAARAWGDVVLDPARCDGALDMALESVEFLSNVLVVDADGDIVCSALTVEEGGPRDVRGQPWFESVRRTGEFTVGAPAMGRITRRWIVAVAVPISGSTGSVAGILAGSVELGRLQSLLDQVRLTGDELVTIFTAADGLILARSSDPSQWVGERVPPNTEPSREALEGGMITNAVDLDGMPRTFGKVDIPELGWRVTAGLPAARARTPALALAARRGGFSLLFLTAAVLLGWSFYRRVAGSLERLEESARAAAHGEIMTIPDSAPDEVQQVVRQLNLTLDRRGEAEERERRAKERYRSVVDNAVFGIAVLGPSGEFLEVNPAFLSMLGYGSPSEFLERGTETFGVAQGIEAVVGDPERMLGPGGVERSWAGRDGTPLLVRIHGSRVETDDGLLGYELLVEDITEERRRTEELRHHQKMEAVGRLAGGVAHDFNNIITVVAGNVQLLDATLDPGDPRREDLRTVLEATSRARDLTRDLLQFSRRTPVERGRFELNAVVEAVERMVGRLVGDDVAFETRLARDLPPAWGDPGQIEQVLMNLVINARDAVASGGRIVVRTLRRDLRTGPGEQPGVGLTVTDDGTGMDAETLSRIFEPFFTTKAPGRGTGLGLANVYGVVRQGGGTVDVSSVPGRGTTFTIVLPVAEAVGHEATLDAPAEDGDARPGSAAGEARSPEAPTLILVVEDEESVRHLVRRVLERDGYEVLEAIDGVEALEVLGSTERPVDLVLTDVVMPRMKGPELAERLAELRPGTPILFMSGYLDNEGLRERFSRTPQIFLAKPFNSTELRQRVRASLDRARRAS